MSEREARRVLDTHTGRVAFDMAFEGRAIQETEIDELFASYDGQTGCTSLTLRDVAKMTGATLHTVLQGRE